MESCSDTPSLVYLQSDDVIQKLVNSREKTSLWSWKVNVSSLRSTKNKASKPFQSQYKFCLQVWLWKWRKHQIEVFIKWNRSFPLLPSCEHPARQSLPSALTKAACITIIYLNVITVEQGFVCPPVSKRTFLSMHIPTGVSGSVFILSMKNAIHLLTCTFNSINRYMYLSV